MKTKIFSILAALAILVMALPGSVMAAAPGDVTLETTVVAPTAVFSVITADESDYVTTLNFGTVIAGRDSLIQTFKLRNDGTGRITVEAGTSNIFYRDSLKLSFDGGATWTTYGSWITPVISGALTLPANLPLIVQAKVHPAVGTITTDPYVGTLTFFATLAP